MAIFCILALALLLSVEATAQQVVAPTPDAVGVAGGENWGGYNFTNSVELGYRFLTLAGNQAEYRSDENFGSGVRLLANSVTVNSRNGRGRLFDSIVLTTSGLGGDPYEAASLRVQKKRLYEYEMMWRRNDYFNPGLVTDGGNSQHLLDTTYQSQDHDLTLFPESKIKFFLGYSRSKQAGAGISTIQLFDSNSNIYPFFSNLSLLRNEYRIGNEIRFFGIRVNWLRAWSDFKDDTGYQLSPASSAGNQQGDSGLQSFSRAEPRHGTNPYWRVALFHDQSKLSIQTLFTYTAGSGAFLTNESALGSDRLLNGISRQVSASGKARRPVATGNLTIALSPVSKFVVANHTAFYNVRTEGNTAFLQFDNASQTAQSLYFQYLGIQTFSNTTDISYELNDRASMHGGYQYSNRRIKSIEQFSAFQTVHPNEQTNQLHAGTFGARIKPVRPLTFTVDGEIGRASFPFTQKSDANYENVSGRLTYKLKTLRLFASTAANYNTNSVTLSTYTSHARTYTAAASWSPSPRFSFDASYAKLHLSTIGGIAFFANAVFQRNESSYVSNIHSGNIGVRLALAKRADIYLGYSHVQDVGDGRGILVQANDPLLSGFQAAQTFPLTFQAPLARVSVRIAERLRWNVGYEYYGYNTEFFSQRNYRAHTGYTSVLWSF